MYQVEKLFACTYPLARKYMITALFRTGIKSGLDLENYIRKWYNLQLKTNSSSSSTSVVMNWSHSQEDRQRHSQIDKKIWKCGLIANVRTGDQKTRIETTMWHSSYKKAKFGNKKFK